MYQSQNTYFLYLIEMDLAAYTKEITNQARIINSRIENPSLVPKESPLVDYHKIIEQFQSFLSEKRV